MRGGPSAEFARELPSPIGPHPLDALLTPERARRYRQVLARRTARLAVVVEDCCDPHNATAVVRTCDAFGLAAAHVVTTRNAFKVNPRISQGAHHYVDLHVHPTIDDAYAALRAQGFRILVTDLAADAVVGPQQLATHLAAQPLAVVFGNEGEGVSPAARERADGGFRVPMAGFTQSLNLSVTVALTLYALRMDALAADAPGDLDAATQTALYERWVRGHRGAAAAAVMRQETGHSGEDLDSFRAPTSA